MAASKAVLTLRPNPRAEYRLFAFSPAGYGASFYRLWPGLMPDWIEFCSVQIPGRENRLGDRPIAEMNALIEKLISELTIVFDRPMLFFGHSMGAWVAFELAGHLPEGVRKQLKGLFLSGRRAPHSPERFPPLHPLPDAEFLAELQRRYGGIPDVILNDPELLAIFLPALRADITLLETYRSPERPAFDIPMMVYAGREDAMTLPDELAAWRRYTQREFDCVTFPGGHFYLQERLPELLAHLNGYLEWVRCG